MPTLPARLLSLAVLAAAVLASFAGVLRNGWVLLDDPEYVTRNPHVLHGLTPEGLRWFLHAPHGGNWHPLTSAVHMLDVTLFGLRPAGHHAVSLGLHLVAALLLALALARLTGAWWRSLLVAALFAVHPLRVESVAWASELKDVLSGVFFMLTLLAYARWAERPGAARWTLVVASLAIGLLAKPMLVTVPFVLVLIDLWPLGRRRGRSSAGVEARWPRGAPPRTLAGLLVEKWSLFALVAASAVVTFVAQRGTGAVVSAASLPLPARLANAALSCVRYLAASAWPHDLAPFYPLTSSVDPGRAALAALALAGMTALAWRARSQPWVLTGWLWYLGMLVPVVGVVQVGIQSHADRYTYLPTIGVGIALVWTLDRVLPAARAVRMAAALAALAALAWCAVATARQVALWRDNRTIFTHTLRVQPANAVAHHCLGAELLEAGRPDVAMPHFLAALQLAPAFVDARLDYGGALAMRGRYAEAIDQFREVLRLKDGPGVRHNLGLALMHLGREDEAVEQYRAALVAEPDHYESLVELATILGRRGDVRDADPMLRRAVAMHPEDPRPRRLLAVTLTLEGDVEGAIGHYRVLVDRDSTDLDAMNNIAWIRATHPDAHHRDGAEALRLSARALAHTDEPLAVLYSTYAAACAEAGRMGDAIAAAERAVELARAERDTASRAAFARQLAGYRAGRPWRVGER